MQVKRIRIVQASLPTFWYAKRLGQQFLVMDVPASRLDDGEGLRLQVIPVGSRRVDSANYYIEVQDAEVLEWFEASVEESVTVSVYPIQLAPEPLADRLSEPPPLPEETYGDTCQYRDMLLFDRWWSTQIFSIEGIEDDHEASSYGRLTRRTAELIFNAGLQAGRKLSAN